MKPFPTHLNNLEEFRKVFDDVDYILTDLDGCLWLHNTVIPGADKFINKIKKLGKKVIFATNNSSKSRSIIKQKLKSLGFQANENEIMVTSYAAAIYLKKLNFDKKAYIFGSTGLEEEFKLLKIPFTGTGPDPLPYNLQDFSLIELDPEIEAVVLGFDYNLSYPKLIKACSYAKKVSTKTPQLFITTNLDETLPTGYSHLCIPGTGALVRSIITAVGREPVVLGKPSKWFFDCIKTINPDIKPDRCLMIGDRINSDIEFANNNEFKYSIFVEGGVSSLKDIEESIKKENDKLVPTHYCKDLGELNKFLDTYNEN